MKLFTLKSTTIIFAILFAFAAGCSEVTSVDVPEEEDETETVEPELTEGTLNMNNNGAQSYTITSISGSGISAETGTANPSVTLEAGGRYTFINDAGGSNHPLDFRDGGGTKLFGQSNATGSMTNDPDINVEKNGNSVTFTLTEELQEKLNDYICSFHPGMKGAFEFSAAE